MSRLRLRLYVAGDTQNSLRARANLSAICRDRIAGPSQIEVVDILKEPMRALGLSDEGAVRAGFLHYSSLDEVDRLVLALTSSG